MNAAMATTGAMIQNPGVRLALGNESVVRVVDIARTIRGGQRSEKNGGKGGRRARALRGAKNAGAAQACGRYDRTLALRHGLPLRRRWKPEGRMVTVADELDALDPHCEEIRRASAQTRGEKRRPRELSSGRAGYFVETKY
jgi:hypothetical protein